MNEHDQQHSERLLSSWKEIATCLNRGVRTVQRWEHFGLPVCRPAGNKSNVVLAVEAELLQWLSQWKNEPRSSDSASAKLHESGDESKEISARLSLLKIELEQIDARLVNLEARLDKLKPARRLPLAS